MAVHQTKKNFTNFTLTFSFNSHRYNLIVPNTIDGKSVLFSQISVTGKTTVILEIFENDFIRIGNCLKKSENKRQNCLKIPENLTRQLFSKAVKDI